MFRDNRAELAYIHVERFTSTMEAEDQSVLPVVRTCGPFAQLVMRGVSEVCSREWIGGTSTYADGGCTEERGGDTLCSGRKRRRGRQDVQVRGRRKRMNLAPFPRSSPTLPTTSPVLSQLVLSFIERLNTEI